MHRDVEAVQHMQRVADLGPRSPAGRAATCRCRQSAARRRPPVPARPSPGAGWLGCAAVPPTATGGSGGRSGRSPSGSCPRAGPCPSGSRPRQWTGPLPAGDGPSPTAQTNPPSDRRPPNWSGRPGPFRRQDNRRAHRARKPIIAVVTGRLPWLQGMCSTPTPCSGHSTRRGRIEEIRRDAPQRHEQPGPLRQPVVARGRLPALGALAVAWPRAASKWMSMRSEGPGRRRRISR